MNKVFGLLGEKLGHSFSPLIHSFLGDYEYHLYEVAHDDFDSFMRERRFDGINVTIPYKQDVMPYCKTLSDEARAIGCVNTIIKDNKGNLHGYNTDYHGFKFMLEYGKINPAGKKVVIAGDGASARTVRTVLNDLDAKEILTASRFGKINYRNIFRHYDADILVNTTPVGMFPSNGTLPLCIKGFKQLTGVVDLIYNPAKTKLLLEIEKLDIPCVGGLSMLVAQAELASRLFHGGIGGNQLLKRADGARISGVFKGLKLGGRRDDTGVYSELELTEFVYSIIRKVLQKTLNIAIIGMPGCGKTSVGRVIAKKTQRQFCDIDELIEATAGKSIAEIFEKDGEDYFRSLETQILSDVSKKSGLVIATGGGVVTQPENSDLLRQNSVIIYLKRDLEELDIRGRPLSDSEGVQALAEQRLDLYELWSDCAVQAGMGVEQTADWILAALGVTE